MFRAIIVDDEELIATNLKQAVPWEELDFRVAGVFANGAAALDFVRREGADLVVTDIRMPAMTGTELARSLSRLPDPPLVLFLTGYGEFDYAREAIRYGVYDYILKPIDYRELADAVYGAAEKLRRKNRLGQSAAAGLLYDVLTGGELILEPPPRLAACQLWELALPADASAVAADAALNDWLAERQRLRPLVYVLSLESGRRSLVCLDAAAAELEAAEPYLIADLRRRLPEGARLASGGAADEWASLPALRAAALAALAAGGGTAAERPPEPGDRLLRKTERYIDAHFCDYVGVEQIADAVGVSVGHLSALYKERYGLTILKRLTALRIEKARSLLADPWLRAHEVAAAVGYRDYRHFSQVFKKHCGCTLMEYRERLLAGAAQPAEPAGPAENFEQG
jgi:two-component system response regulator YesN